MSDMATFTKFQPFVEAIAHKQHNLQVDTLKIALTNTAPTNTDSQFLPGSLHPPPAATNGYTSGGHSLTVTASSQAAGIYSIVASDLIITASGGNLGPFRYALLYNDSAVNDLLIGYWDYGSSLTLADGESITLDLGSSIFTLQ